jgi:hypothetical protein
LKYTTCLQILNKQLFNVPHKLIKLINIILQHTKVKVKINDSLTEQFEVSTGIKQGDALSTLYLAL